MARVVDAILLSKILSTVTHDDSTQHTTDREQTLRQRQREADRARASHSDRSIIETEGHGAAEK